MTQKLEGLFAAVHTPLHEDCSLNLDSVEAIAERLVATEVSGAYVCGTTGEFASLQSAERKLIAQRWKDVAGGKLQLIQQVGSCSAQESRDLAEHAQKTGFDAVSSIGPYFFKPKTVDDLVTHCAEIASGAPDLPFYYYHLPGLSGVFLPMVEFLEKAHDRIPSLAGIKFSHPDFMDLGLCLDLNRFDILFGIDEALLCALALGVRGAVGSTYNYAAPLSNDIIKKYDSGDLESARELQARSRALVSVILQYGVLPATKAAMELVGVDCGPVRSPLTRLDPAARKNLHADLEAAGFDELTRIRPHSAT